VPVRGGFGIDWGFDRAQRLQGTGSDYTGGTVGLAYMPSDRLRGSVQYELRQREDTGHVLAAGLAGRLAPGVTALANYRMADDGTASGLTNDRQAMGAIAWRPEASDRFGLLLSYNYGDRGAALAQEAASARVGRLSTDGYLAPGRGLELHSRLAMIRSEGGAFAQLSTAYLYQGRVQQRLLRYFDLAVEGRLGWDAGSDTKRSAIGAEIGVWALPDLRLGAGYRTRPVDESGLPVLDVNHGRMYFVLTSRLAGFFNLLGPSTRGMKP